MRQNNYAVMKNEDYLEVLKAHWGEIQEWVLKTYNIASVDYRTEILPMQLVNAENDQNGNLVAYVKLDNTDKYLDTYIELRYSEFFTNAVMELLNIKCSFSFDADGYKSNRGFIRRWISNVALLGSAQKKIPKRISEEELSRAMTLFMIKDITTADEAFLRRQRNRLIKAFHPDGNDCSNEYAVEINKAYEVLNSYIKSH